MPMTEVAFMIAWQHRERRLDPGVVMTLFLGISTAAFLAVAF
jgi:hypothetical protein